ncbi:integrating conjugative element protein [Vibrio parahaemolyticus]|uniref:integrating conjugative element protein n=1 Tax=Vibrio parahaemolyticus TaxID=670 RepID=UPI00186A391D|nr:integrating conjugative element protein [Vibrio parahaemolyticus]MBE3793542.1 integrating conjugative element protein [Vibrio parahaemolyticus]MBE3866402.1 integrating conjugative element protein [Vibrio parahaemolyticus]MCZ5880332.1 integrating conjugative element protein [Vibrio parahaemolyticus]MDF4424231.1 integrating conjugative element protein [Vibrio parahaemolyticus]MDF4582609.1 integrating conjugative element protein [Vibrio parahaemolyticus]
MNTQKNIHKVKTSLALLISATLLGIHMPVSALTIDTTTSGSTNTDVLHYTLGGGPVISLPARAKHIDSHGLGVGWDMNLQCGMLDPKLTVQNQLNGVTDGFQDMMGDMLTNATSAVLSLPGYYLQKKDPGLYDLMTNGVLQGKFDFDDARTSCEEMVTTMGEMTEEDAYSTLARAQAWTNAVKSGDAVQAKEDVLNDMGDSGITWVGGIKAGGRNQPAINATTDATRVGFELLTDDEQKEAHQGLYQYWDDEEAMSDWVSNVIGSQSIQTGMDKSQTESTPGIGLSQEVTTEGMALESELRQALLDDMETSHFPRVLLDALKERQVDDNTLSRIASELALSHTIEKALYARRALLSGKYEVNIAQHTAAQQDITEAVHRLEGEIDMLRYEAQVRQDVGTRTALSVVDELNYQRPQAKPKTQTTSSVFLEKETTANSSNE